MLIQWSYTGAAGVDLLLPASYDVIWSALSLVVLVGPVWLVVRLVRGRGTPGPTGAADAARRHATAVSTLSWTALTVTLVAGLAIVAARPVNLVQGLLYGVVPAVAGTTLAVVQGIGELTWPRPEGTVRRAPLVRRTVLDVAPRGLLRLFLGWAIALGLVLTVTGILSSSGREITRAWPDGSSSAGPFPGWFYGVPLVVATGVVVLATAAALRLIARRPAVSDTAPEWDMALRRMSAHRLLRGSQLVLGLTLAAVLFFTGVAVRSLGSGSRVDGVATGSTGHVVVGVVVLLLGITVLLATLAATTLPAPPVPSPEGAAADRTGARP